MSIYCIKCHKHTGTKAEHQVQAKNGRTMLQGGCLECGSKKSKIMAGSKQGRGCSDRPVSTTGANVVSPMHVRPVGKGKKSHKGGQISEALEVLKPIQDLVGAIIPTDQAFEDKFNRWLNGHGLKKKSKHFLRGLKAHHYMHHHIHGGDIGSDIKDFFQGFSYGFTHPDQGFKALGKLITGGCADDRSNKMGKDHNCGEKTNDWQEEQREWVGKGFQECDCAHKDWDEENSGPPRSGAGRKRKSSKKGGNFQKCDCAHKAWDLEHGLGNQDYESLSGAGLTFY